MLPDEQTSPEQIEIYRRMTPQQRWQVAQQMYWDARHLKEAAVRIQHPEWSELEVRAEVSRIFLNEAMKEG